MEEFLPPSFMLVFFSVFFFSPDAGGDMFLRNFR
jgi:hypothetical protein